MDQLHTSLNLQPGSQEEPVHNKRKRDPNEDGANQLLTHLSVPALPEVNNVVDVQKLLDVLQSFQAKTVSENGVSEWSRSKRSKTEDTTNLSRSPQAETPKILPTLPEDLWQRIFGYVPPVFLGRLLRVSRSFSAYLSAPKGSQMEPFSPSGQEMEPPTAEKVWISSRKRFCPGLPKPLCGLRELDMWRLLRGSKCQICDKHKRHVYTSDLANAWEKGPERDGLRFVWPFGIRCCIPCLRNSCEKELSLRISPTLDFPKDLIPALPFIFMTSADHYLNIAALGDSERPPFLQFDKYYYKAHINLIKVYFEQVKALGEGSTEEWLKGLPVQANAQLADYTRFEKWELKGGLKKVNHRSPSKSSSVSEAMRVDEKPDGKSIDHIDLSNKRSAIQGQSGPISDSSDGRIGILNGNTASDEQALSSNPSVNQLIPMPSIVTQPQNRLERSIHDINDARVARKAEIERRCAVLSPPLDPRVLMHMESFQAAMQITQPMTDSAWDILRPRLLAQRSTAEKQERENRPYDDNPHSEDTHQTPEEATDPSDRDWEAYQIPVRDQIGAIADAYVADKWARGKRITKETAPQFAAEVLSHVRERFYEQVSLQDRAARTAGQPIRLDRPGEPPSRTLILENMKWIHDNKVKPRTDRFQSELFLCAGCPGNFKFYGFEGVVQHYAAKHTSSLSQGNSVVHWRAEWPQQPVYNPDPGTAKAAFYKIPTPATTSLPNPPPREKYQQESHQAYGHPPPGHGTPVHHGVQPYQPPPSTHPGDRGLHLTQANTYFPNHDLMQPVEHGFSGQPPPPVHGFMPPPPNYGPPPPGPYGHADYNLGYPPPAYSGPPPTPYYPPPHQYPPHPIPQHGPPQYRSHGANPNGYYPPPVSQAQYPSSFPQQARHQLGPGRNPQPIPHTQDMDLYKRQLDEMAKHAREVWFATASIKDMPQSVRISVVIHHTASRYAAAFGSEPTLAMFQDGLNNNAKMRPVRSLNGLGCNACVIQRREAELGHRPAMPAGIGDRRLFTLPLLLNHFRSQHVEPALASGSPVSPDWKREMIELPDIRVVGDLIDAIGIDDAKLGLLAAVFPNAFPSPLPRVGSSITSGPVPNFPGDLSDGTRPGHALGDQFRSPQNVRQGNTVSQFAGEQQQSTDPPREDEYDPHRPANLQTIIKSEPNSARLGKRISDEFVPDPLQELSRNLGSYREEYHKSHSSLTAKDSDLHQPSTTARLLSTSPAQAAERFLQELPIKELNHTNSLTASSPWQNDELAMQRRLPTAQDGDGHDIVQVLDRSPTNANGHAPSYSPRTILNDGQQDDEYRPPSRIEAPSIAVRPDSVSSQRSVLYQREQEPTYRRETTEVRYVQDVYRNKNSPPLAVRASIFRSRSRSPRSGYAVERAIVEGRPQDDVRQDSYYRVLSPPPREDSRSQRLVRYEYGPAERYAYVEDRPHPEPPYRQEVQYIPVEVDRHGPAEQGRYVYAQPVESRPRQPEYVRYEGGYQDGSVYERNGQLYRTQSAQDLSAYPRAYRY